MATKYYMEIVETIADSYELPEVIRLKVADKKEAKDKAKEFETLFVAKPNYKVLFHTHTHGPLPQDNVPCVTEDIKAEVEAAPAS